MKRLILFYLLSLSVIIPAYSDVQNIVSGDQPGEIYFNGPVLYDWGNLGFYYSSDYGNTIELRDSVNLLSYGVLLRDASEEHIYRVFEDTPGYTIFSIYLSSDGGYNWCNLDSGLVHNPNLASGTIDGEIYRQIYNGPSLERSVDYGATFNLCSSQGLNANGYQIAVGADSGEVYFWGAGELYYSSDYGESVYFLNDLLQAFSVNPSSSLIKGTEPGEVYIYDAQYQHLWRSYAYGDSLQDIVWFCQMTWYCSGVATTDTAGEIYILVNELGMGFGGIVHIFHTMDYGADWTETIHNIDPYGIVGNREPIPGKIELSVFPNPSNNSINIRYSTDVNEGVCLCIYNSLGQKMWDKNAGKQVPGVHLFNYSAENLSSGIYFLEVRNEKGKESIPFTIIK